jgi:hypothetical protein
MSPGFLSAAARREEAPGAAASGFSRSFPKEHDSLALFVGSTEAETHGTHLSKLALCSVSSRLSIHGFTFSQIDTFGAQHQSDEYTSTTSPRARKAGPGCPDTAQADMA